MVVVAVVEEDGRGGGGGWERLGEEMPSVKIRL